MSTRRAIVIPRWLVALVTTVACTTAGRCLADGAEDAFKQIPWTAGPGVGSMGAYAEIKIPENFLFTGPEGTQQFLKLTENPPNPKTVGVLFPTEEGADFIVFFSYEDSGHVKDDDSGSIDASSLLSGIKAANDAGNEERRRQGWEGIQVTDWVVPPGYEAATHRLAWGVRARTDGGQPLANYDVRVLGRTGVMSVTLACPPEQVQTLIPRLQELLGGFEFKAGHRYSEWRSGDKLAAYGLTGLIAGGSVVAAAKAGWLAKLVALFAKGGKAIVVGVIAVLGGLWRLLSGRKAKSSTSPPQ